MNVNKIIDGKLIASEIREKIKFYGDKLKSTREIFEGKDCIISRITDKNGNTRISQIEYPLIYADNNELFDSQNTDNTFEFELTILVGTGL